MIYPCIYCIYAMVLPFIAKASVYGQFTNLNPQLVIYGRAGSALALVVFIPALCLFFGLLCGYKAIFKKVNKENNGKNITR
ncbi:MAG: DUF1600 domain-containing protein [Mycoplasmoidaceae bacterium]|nr:DUF1600 domain-containing protein [Mycoplasmoidaceae bacterium]